MNEWWCLNTGPGDPAWNMALDEALLEGAASLGKPVLRFYGWTEKAATFGYFQKYRDIERWTSLRPLIRRPTGGGLVPHDSDWTYTVTAPPGHEWHALRAEESYARVHAWVRSAFQRMGNSTELSHGKVEAFGRCFAGAEKFDLLREGTKIAGAAQRRNKCGLLIQGSVQNQPPGAAREEWEQRMIESARDEWGVHWEPLPLAGPLAQRAEQLRAEKYFLASYNQRR